jgi:hypothetical protein
MMLASLLLVLAGASTPAAGHFDVSARFVPGKAAGSGDVAVTFVAHDPDVHVNENPAPRLKLDPAQKVLVAKPVKSAPVAPPAPGEAKYLDLAFPVLFPVTASEPSASASVKATVTYFYCSKRDGWCRKGTQDVEVPVSAR